MKLTRILSGFLCLVLVMSLSVTAFAANEDYSFKVTAEEGNTDEFYDEYRNYNYKTQPSDPATIKCYKVPASDPLPGLGFYLHLVNEASNIYTYSYWYNNDNPLRHPTYVNLANANHKNYCIKGRFDNDYGGTYELSGVFNADYTNP